MKSFFVLATACGLSATALPAPDAGNMKGMDMGAMPMGTSTPPSGPKKAPTKPTNREGTDHSAMPGMDHSPMDHSQMSGMNMSMGTGGMMMRSTTDVASPMGRESSGTAWQPDSSPMYMYMKMKGRDTYMAHGTIYPRFTTINSNRDVSVAGKGTNSKFDAPSMFMGMYIHALDRRNQPRSQVGVRLMLSADPLIERGYGYPLLFQSGESYDGQPLHDRQHPHDLFSEISATYSRRIGSKQSAYLYLGYPGEPALGPPTFMHRVSGMDIADAPLAHHWEDSTHITFGVATLSYNLGRIKIEGSSFNGREPDENRYNFDSPRLDSYSGRVSWNPGNNLALQASYGYIKSPEDLRPNENQNRTTASVLYNKVLGADANLASAFVYGQNVTTGEGLTRAYTLETALQRKKNTFFLRAEHVQKSGEELALAAADEDNIYGINALSLGYVHDLSHGKGLDVGLGIQGTLSDAPSSLNSYYGSGPYTGVQIFLRIRPSKMKMSSMNGMGGMNMDSTNKNGASMNDMK